MSLMFDKKAVEEAPHQLMRLLRRILYIRRISNEDYSRLWAEHGERMHYNKHDVSTDRNNSRKALNASGKDITFWMFSFIISNIIRLPVVEMRAVLRDPKTGKLYVFGSNDPVDAPPTEYREQPDPDHGPTRDARDKFV